MNLTSTLSEVPRIGSVHQKRLQHLGMHTVQDLLFYFPRTYEDLSRVVPIQDIHEGSFFCVMGKILEITEQRTFKKRISLTQGMIEDSTGALRVVWFNQPYLKDSLLSGNRVCLAGKVLRDKKGIYLSNPSHEKIQEGEGRPSQLTHVGRIVPIYNETTGISSRWLRSIIKSILAQLSPNLTESLPAHILQEKRFPSLKDALWHIHFPDSMESANLAQKRFAFEQLFFIMLFIFSERKKLDKVKAPRIEFNAKLMKRFTSSLSFQLTDAQKKSAWQILKDMEHPRPMNRLLEGDVGSGKTVVATMASLSVIKAGYQAVFMAPTEILAQQHFKTVSALLAPFHITVGFLTGSQDKLISPKLPNEPIEISRSKLLEKTKNNQVQILIGTHALIQEKAKFANLGFLIIDEQHRFGVKQRLSILRNPRQALIPHLLSLTATPIPRTLAMSIYGDLDISLINELPKGRKKIFTSIVAPNARKKAYACIAKQLEQGRQAFVVCPRIEKSQILNPKFQTIEAKTVKEEYEKLSKDIFPQFVVAMLHGKMATKEKEDVIKKFKREKIDILVSTSVIEVGMDIPNASVMMIEGAERFGLAQLHQFRGRVGRAEHQSYCFLLTESTNPKTYQRLQAIEKLETGFELAEIDLKLRGPGDFAGTRQWGIPDFAMQHIANIKLVQETKEAAKAVLEKDISLQSYPLLKKKLEELKTTLHLE